MGIKNDATRFTSNLICNTVVHTHITLEGDSREQYCEYMTVEDVIYMPPLATWWAATWLQVLAGAKP